MKRFLPFFAIAVLTLEASCDRTALTPVKPSWNQFAAATYDALPQTLHVVPFYDYGKKGYQSLFAGGGFAGFIGSANTLYSATIAGGSTTCSTRWDQGSTEGCGIVYRLVPKSGSEAEYALDVLHTFEGAPNDGAASFSTLLADKLGNLYGTTYYGGKYDGGTVFELHPTSSGYTETILHSFGYGQDGAYPASGVIEVDGALYGTTIGGGAYSNQALCGTYGSVPNGTCGTVYRVNPTTGAENVLHSFGKLPDGASPYAALVGVGNTLYGTTDLGGTSSGCGTVFTIGKDGGSERVVHSFLNAAFGDGCNPFASLIVVKGSLYGTTCCGGGNFGAHREGTLFSVDISTGKEQVLHEFGQGQDGSEPGAAVVSVRGVLYGTTQLGGKNRCGHGYGCGTIFGYALSPTNSAYNVLYRFKSLANGANPRSPFLYSQHAFYGTTTSGGKKGLGAAIRVRP